MPNLKPRLFMMPTVCFKVRCARRGGIDRLPIFHFIFSAQDDHSTTYEFKVSAFDKVGAIEEAKHEVARIFNAAVGTFSMLDVGTRGGRRY